MESEEKAAALLFSRITPARVDEHVPIHYVRLIVFCILYFEEELHEMLRKGAERIPSSLVVCICICIYICIFVFIFEISQVGWMEVREYLLLWSCNLSV